ncbi:hypothetical protein ISN45_At05g018780 [Arabidopsis thaliana x Arabidopsis arenosa]|uniref:Uncharacterized protein n=2 Tax=Arabidopsis TaxID=3701 RepID=A0A8T2DHI6_ARASU|nr:hypothetical protein ISN45_At05g018780 [Arabidopsis thaliana x Arabidopsis arenosa]KAG7609800.1 hypothetical protein ISN44_As05g018710 [Arabidopsis suecica]
MCVDVVRCGRVFGTLVRELGEKRQKGRGHGAVPLTST